MAQRIETRKTKAERLMRMCRSGPGGTPTTESVRTWLRIRVIPLVEDLVPEIKKEKNNLISWKETQ